MAVGNRDGCRWSYGGENSRDPGSFCIGSVGTMPQPSPCTDMRTVELGGTVGD
jgi:hypothetical protein